MSVFCLLAVALFPACINGFFCNQMNQTLGTLDNANFTNYTGVGSYSFCFTFATRFVFTKVGVVLHRTLLTTLLTSDLLGELNHHSSVI